MSQRIVYRPEPMKIGKRVGPEILPGYQKTRRPVGGQAVTLRLPPSLLASVRREAKEAGQTLSEFVRAKLRKRR